MVGGCFSKVIWYDNFNIKTKLCQRASRRYLYEVLGVIAHILVNHRLITQYYEIKIVPITGWVCKEDYSPTNHSTLLSQKSYAVQQNLLIIPSPSNDSRLCGNIIVQHAPKPSSNNQVPATKLPYIARPIKKVSTIRIQPDLVSTARNVAQHVSNTLVVRVLGNKSTVQNMYLCFIGGLEFRDLPKYKCSAWKLSRQQRATNNNKTTTDAKNAIKSA